MAPRKRARTSSTSGSSSSSAAAPTITLDGGEPCPSKQVALWRSGRLTDTVVTVEGATFAAHRLVLAAACGFFERHYDHEHMRDADHPKLLEHVTAAAFEPLLTYLYEGTCTFDESLLTPVLHAAHYLGVAPLERAAVVAFTERLLPSNALAAWTWGEELELPELSDAAKVTALQGFDEVVEKIEEATVAQMQALVADDRLATQDEEAVFSAVARFAEAKRPAEAELLGLLRHVRFALMSPSFLHETVRTSPMLQTVAGKDLLVDVFMPRVSGAAVQPRVGVGGRFLYVMGGRKYSIESMQSVEIYDTLTNTWAAGTPMPTKLDSAAIAMLDGKIFVVGGRKEPTVFDPQTSTWTAVAPMAQARHFLSAAAVGGKLYAIGGRRRTVEAVFLSTVEAFDPTTGAWAAVAPLPAPRWDAAAVVLNGKIYVTGGSDASSYQKTVFVYDPQTDTWATAPPMLEARYGHGAAVLGGKIYVAGGYGGGRVLETAEAFDPQTGVWAAVAPMSTPRDRGSLSAVRGKLYMVGGRTRIGGEPSATAEAYNPQQDDWEEVAPMAQGRRSHLAVAML